MLSATSNAQRQMLYEVSGDVNMAKSITPAGYGVGLGISKELFNHVYFGVGTGAIKIPNHNKTFVPVTGKITAFLPDNEGRKFVPFIAADMGLGIYEDDVLLEDNISMHIRGKGIMQGNVGLNYITPSKATAFVSVGFSAFLFEYSFSKQMEYNIYPADYGLYNRILLKLGFFL